MTATSTTSPEEKRSEDSVKKKRKKIKTEDGKLQSFQYSETVHRISQELPNCNWLEKKIKMESCKQEESDR